MIAAYTNKILCTSKTGALNGLYSKAIQDTALAERYMLGSFMHLLSSAEFSFEINCFQKYIFQEYE